MPLAALACPQGDALCDLHSALADALVLLRIAGSTAAGRLLAARLMGCVTWVGLSTCSMAWLDDSLNTSGSNGGAVQVVCK